MDIEMEVMDMECIALVEALNRIEGIVTTSSCSGHGRGALNVYLRATKVGLTRLAKIMDSRYGGPFCTLGDQIYSEMCAELQCIDIQPFFTILLHSRHLQGREAYEAADRLTHQINSFTAHDIASQTKFIWVEENI